MMVHKTPSPVAGHMRIVFELPATLWADRVAVTGDFNQWCPASTPLQQAADGVWRAVLDLPVGQQYRFRYLLNGDWRTDSQADGFALCERNRPASMIDLNQ